MTELKIDFTSTVDKAIRDAKSVVERNIATHVSGICRQILNTGRWDPEGLGHEIMRKKVEEYVLSEEFAQKCDEVISSVMSEEITKAARSLINSRARKHMFQPTSPIEEERQ